MDTPLVSVIVPCYNGEKFIKEAIESALAQTYSDLEVIVVDDGSIDTSRTIIASFKDPRVRYHYKKNEGVSAARNLGIRLSRGAYIAFLDADDLWLPAKLSQQVREIERDSAIALVHCSSYIVNAGGETIGEVPAKGGSDILRDLLLIGNVVGSPSGVLVKKSVLEAVGCFDESLSTAADWDLWIRIAQKFMIARIAEPLLKYRMHDHNMHKNISLQERETNTILGKFFSAGSLAGKYRAIRRRSISNAYLMLAKSHFKCRSYANSLKALAISLVHYPQNLAHIL